jgi:hypothetical protein
MSSPGFVLYSELDMCNRICTETVYLNKKTNHLIIDWRVVSIIH